MIVYGVFYIPYVHESAAALLSLHANRQGAERAVERAKDAEAQHSKIETWQEWYVAELEVHDE